MYCNIKKDYNKEILVWKAASSRSQTLSTGVPFLSFQTVFSYASPFKKLHNSQTNTKRHECLTNIIEKDTSQSLKTSKKLLTKQSQWAEWSCLFLTRCKESFRWQASEIMLRHGEAVLTLRIQSNHSWEPLLALLRWRKHNNKGNYYVEVY